MEAWGAVQLTSVTSTGNVTQIYPSWILYSPGVTAGAALPIAAGGILRTPQGGRYGQVAVETDSTYAGTIQIFDINGLDVVADVSSGTTITNTQLTTAIAAGKAKLIFEQNFASAPGSPIIWDWTKGFLKGLAARFIGPSDGVGTCKLSFIAEGGFSFRICAGAYAGG